MARSSSRKVAKSMPMVVRTSLSFSLLTQRKASVIAVNGAASSSTGVRPSTQGPPLKAKAIRERTAALIPTTILASCATSESSSQASSSLRITNSMASPSKASALAQLWNYIQVHYNQDDGIEFFGGTVNAKYLYCSGIRDDSFDWTDGWTGKGQFWVAQQHGDDADNGFEADNDGDNNEATPRSNPTIYNVTLVGDPDGPESDTGLLLREGTAATLRNFIVIGFNKVGLDVDNSSTFIQANSGALSLQNTIFFNNKVGGATEGVAGNFETDSDEFDEAMWATNPQFNNAQTDPMLMDPYSKSSPDFTPGAGSPAVNGTVPVASPPDDGFFDSVDFIGGVDPANNWLKGWTTNETPAGQ